MKYILCLFLLLSSLISFSQENILKEPSLLNKIKLPPSPNAAALGKYGEVPVSQFTGIPNINIPLYEVKEGVLSLPISLNYHSSGFKVGEMASWAGLGFSLNAGGVITRVIQGKPDESTLGYRNIMNSPNSPIQVPDPITQNSEFHDVPDNLTHSQKELFASGRWDGLPDVFYFNFLGRTGRILFTKSGIYTLPFQKLKIECNINSWTIESWTITDERGVKYLFGKSDTRNGTEITEYQNACGIDPENTTASAWYIMDIIAPNGDNLHFNYEDEFITNSGQLSQTRYINLTPFRFTNADGACYDMATFNECQGTYLNISGKRLKNITFSNGEIQFIGTNVRKDIFPGNTAKQLDQIVILDSNGNIKKKYNFQFGYLGDLSTSYPYDIKCRLLLNSVQEEGEGGVLKPPYRFVYKTGSIPDYKSSMQDHWGYYNGKTNYTGIIPGKIGSSYDKLFFKLGYVADKEPDPSFSSIGLIKKIIYPNGGYSDFDYERHDYSNINGANYPGEYKKVEEYKTANVSIPASGVSSVKEMVTSFSINSEQEVLLSYRMEMTAMTGRGENYVSLVKVDDSSLIFSYVWQDNSLRQDYMTLQPGNYKLVAHIEDKGYYADINIKYNTTDYSVFYKNKEAGGFRIRKIIDNDGINNIVTNYGYTLKDDSQKSSGVLNAEPVYEYFTSLSGKYTEESAMGPRDMECTCNYVVRSSNSFASLGASDGGIVTYREVTVQKDSGENGFIRSYYTSAYEFPDIIYKEPPFAPTLSNSVKRGSLIAEITYDKDNRILQKVVNNYKLNKGINDPNIYGQPLLAVAYGLKRAMYTDLNTYKYTLFDIRSGWNYLQSSTKTTFSYANNRTDSVSYFTRFSYSNPSHIQETRNVIYGSSGDSIVTESSYPDEMILKGKDPGGIYAAMKDLNIISPLIEQTRYKNNTQVSFSRTNYYNPYSTTFQPRSVELQKGISSAIESRLFYHSHDTRGNVLSLSNEGNPRLSYVWGSQLQYPIAEVKNASDNEIYFTSFEEGSGFDGSLSLDASKSHNGGYSGKIVNPGNLEKVSHASSWLAITQSGPRLFKYSGWVYSDGPSAEIFLFMKRAGETGYFSYVDAIGTSQIGKWVFIEKEYLVPADVSQLSLRLDNNAVGTVWFDDLRLHPSNAEMTTYTYKPLVGMTSSTDARGQTTYYEYDNFQRLQSVKDASGNVLKSYDYHYKP